MAKSAKTHAPSRAIPARMFCMRIPTSDIEKLRAAARDERRSLSGYLLNSALERLEQSAA